MKFKLLIFDWEGTLREQAALQPGVAEWLPRLKNIGYELAVATGKSRRGLDEDLRKFELNPYFTLTRTAEETFPKPHPLMVNEISTLLGMEKSQVLMIGDTHYDLQMAINAGCASVLMRYRLKGKEALQQYHPLATFDSFDDLGKWLM